MEITIIQAGDSLPYVAHGHSTEQGRSAYVNNIDVPVDGMKVTFQDAELFSDYSATNTVHTYTYANGDWYNL